MGWIYLLLIVVSFSSLALFSRLSIRNGGDAFGFNFWLFAGGMIFSSLMLFFGRPPIFSVPPVGFGLASAIANVTAGVFFAMALLIGHYGFSVSILSASFIISVLYSSIKWQQPIMLEGLVVIIISIFLIASSKQENEKKGNWNKWLVLILAAFFFNGFPQIAQAHASLLLPEENKVYLFTNFSIGTIILIFITRVKGSFKGPNLIYGLLASVGSFFGTFFTIKACTVMPKTMVFPVFFSGYNITALLLSSLFFKEKISLKGFLGIILGISGVIIISLKLTIFK